MDNEPDVTLAHMEETRSALSDKMELLGNQMADTMRSATSAVNDTVDNVKDAVNDTVDNVKDMFDLPLQMRRHPWGMVAGAVALGCVGGYVLQRRRAEQPRVSAGIEPAPRLATQGNGAAQVHRLASETLANESRQEAPAQVSEVDWLNDVNSQFGAEITRVKGLAIGTVLSLVRDMIIPSVPDHLKAELAGVINSVTVKLGGEPVQGPLWTPRSPAREERHSSERREPR